MRDSRFPRQRKQRRLVLRVRIGHNPSHNDRELGGEMLDTCRKSMLPSTAARPSSAIGISLDLDWEILQGIYRWRNGIRWYNSNKWRSSNSSKNNNNNR